MYKYSCKAILVICVRFFPSPLQGHLADLHVSHQIGAFRVSFVECLAQVGMLQNFNSKVLRTYRQTD